MQSVKTTSAIMDVASDTSLTRSSSAPGIQSVGGDTMLIRILTLCCGYVHSQIPGAPVSSNDAVIQLQGKTGSTRAAVIAQVAPHLNAGPYGSKDRRRPRRGQRTELGPSCQCHPFHCTGEEAGPAWSGSGTDAEGSDGQQTFKEHYFQAIGRPYSSG